MFISVVIPTHNRSHTLERAIESVLLQKGVSWELIVVNDGSKDEEKTVKLLKSFVKKDSRISFVTTENKGVSAARNLGVEKARGQWIAFLDSDDEWMPGKLEAQSLYVEKYGGVWNQTCEIWIRNGKRVNPPRHLIKKEGDLFFPSLKRCMITPSSLLIKKNTFEMAGGFDESYPACEDYDLWIRLVSKYPISLLNQNYLIRYGGHKDQLSHRYPALDQFRIRSLFNLWKQQVLTNIQTELLESTLREKIVIYQKGCAKREKQKEVEWCKKLLELLNGVG